MPESYLVAVRYSTSFHLQNGDCNSTLVRGRVRIVKDNISKLLGICQALSKY